MVNRQRGRAWLWLLAALAAGAVGWWYYAPQTLPTALRHAAPVSPSADRASPPLYKWRDDAGRLNVTDVPPTGGRKYETVRYDPDTNVVPGYRAPNADPRDRPIPPDPERKQP
ncbi:MAG TPA: DUF4124 domain-containing protein [Tahibacter sp.]|nr:DUF4124 domain-containing protein [Tahibacter sp.]